MTKTKKKDFIELVFTGKANGNIFDSNIPEDLKSINPEAEAKKLVISIGEKMVVPGLDEALEDKEVGEFYTTLVPKEKAFGERERDLVKTIPLRVFTEQKINPVTGASLLLDNRLVKIIAVSGSRVIVDFNNPLSGKDLEYKFKIEKIITDVKEKAESFFEHFFRTIPDFEVLDSRVKVKGPKLLEGVINTFKEKFKEIVDVDLEFEEKQAKKE